MAGMGLYGDITNEDLVVLSVIIVLVAFAVYYWIMIRLSK
jgi:hypothetical protein